MENNTQDELAALRANMTLLQEQQAALLTEITHLRGTRQPGFRIGLPRRVAVLVLGLASFAVTLLAGTLVYASTPVNPVQNDIVHACFQTSNGKNFRLIDPAQPKTACKKNETALNWQEFPAHATVSGTIDGSTGNIVSGKGFTSVRNAAGNYTITVPAGTFASYAAIAFTPVGRYPQFVFDGGYGANGVYVFNVASLDGQDTSFSFVAVDTN